MGIGLWIACAAALVFGQGVGSAASAAPGAPAAASATITLRWMSVPRVAGRLDVRALGVVINMADPYSIEVGEYYVQRRRIPPEQVLRVDVPLKARLTESEALALKHQIDRHFGSHVQALALAWTLPYAAECQSINAVLALGFDASLCRQTCDRPPRSTYFNSRSAAPFTDHHVRPSMLLAARSPAHAKALIDRGVSADHTLGLRGALPAHAYYMASNDAARSVRAPLFPPPGLFAGKSLQTHVQRGVLPADAERVLLVQTGASQLPPLEGLPWVGGALADHLTSFGGLLDQRAGEGQSTALDWLEAGATASYGTVSEPCNHPQKFPHPQLLLLHYLQGSTAIEAYWKSVAWPQQGAFVGEPLAAPFAPR